MKKTATPAERPAESAVLGAGPPFQGTLELFGRTDQDGMAVTHYGYLTYLHGLPLESLFFDPRRRDETSARLTFSGRGTIDSRHETGNIITTAAPGELVIYRNTTPGGDWTAPASFARGEPVATFTLRYYCILNVDLRDANVGAVSVVIDLSQHSATPLTLEDRPAAFGRAGLRLRGSASGEGWLTGRDPFRAYFLFGAQFVAPG